MVLSHIAVPVAFAYLAYLEIAQKLNVRWETIGCFVLATLPFILILLTRYIKRFNLGGNSFESADQSSATKEFVENLEASDEEQKEIDFPKPDKTEIKFSDMSKEARRVLRTLWHFQMKLFTLDSNEKRFGFVIGPHAPDYFIFNKGAWELLARRFIVRDEKGMVFLSDKGIEFVKRIDVNNALKGGGELWSEFDN